ncbi:MAG: hypothetical protein E6J62_09190 [Deltaproteobacteria bacterium]|nr:MAG: hypothetical protein E6J85_02330 [Deltaproteobacteria bacterium]TMB32612.1 MAG: hypothetical protein E6J61_06950 [Deltaproteobacteria bacterium]TMB35520.1 MAG: hypothetical protein E6J62_09190 [Deltaproteobacteria bacterium]
MEKILAVAALALFLCRPAVATTARELRELRGSAFKAYQGKDWPAFFEAQKRVVQAARIPRELYQLACAAALAGDKSAALRALEDFADQDTFLDAANDGDLASLRGEPRYEKALRRIAYSRAARGTTPTAAELPRADLVVEDLARSGQDWFLSSVRKRAIFKLSRGSLIELARTPWAALGMALEPATNTLWVTTAALDEEEDHDKADQGRSAILEIDAATGAVKARHDSPAKGALADLRVFDGAAYASDGFGGGVYRVTSKGFEKLSDDFASPQTPAMHGGELLVPDYTLGLAVLDLGTRKVRWLEAPKGFPLTGIDGTALAGDDLYIVQNGLDPVRVVKLTLDRRNRIVKAALVQKGGDLPDPTHAVIHDGALWFIARSGWQGFGKNGFQPGPPPLLKRVPLR